MMTVPPPRYRVIERGRRLVTLDSLHGVEVGLASLLQGDPTFGISRPTPALEAAAAMPARMPVPQARAAPLEAPPVRVIANAPHSSMPSAASVAEAVQPGRVAVVAFGLLAITIFLIASSLWIGVVLLLWLPQSRGFILAGAKRAASRIGAWTRGR